MRTISTLGLVGLGIIAGQKRYKEDIWGWIKDGYYYKNEYGYWVYVQTNEWKVRGYETKNWLFAGITLWVADVIWVFVKGTENEKLKMFSNYSFNANVSNGITNLSLSFKF